MNAILCFSGHDPSGGAGLIADIETAHALNSRACSIPTAITAQNSFEVHNFQSLNQKLFFQMFSSLIADEIQFDAIKIGMIGSVTMLNSVVKTLDVLNHIPVIYDPVLVSSSGQNLFEPKLIQAIKKKLLPRVYLCTPNIHEYEVLSDSIHHSEHLLVTGGHGDFGSIILNQLHMPSSRRLFLSKRLPAQVRGTGCMLSTAITCLLSQGNSLPSSVKQGIDFVHSAIHEAVPFGYGQWRAKR